MLTLLTARFRHSLFSTDYRALVAELHSDGGEERIDTSGRACC